jgi:dephospho-CoA kinase
MVTSLGRIVFADEEARAALNAIVHPAVRDLGSAYELLAKPDQLVIHVVPLLFEEGFAGRCAFNVLVIAPESVRVARVSKRDGLAEEEILARMDRQIDPSKARTLADHIIENSGNFKELEKNTKAVYEQLLAQD